MAGEELMQALPTRGGPADTRIGTIRAARVSRLARWAILLLLCVFVAASGLQPVCAEESKVASQRLTVRPKVGDVIRWRFRRKETSKPAAETKTRTVQREVVFRCTIVDVPSGGGAVLDFVEESATGRFPLPDGAVHSYDTGAKSPASDDIDARMGTLIQTFLVGVKVRVTLDARGAVTEARGVREAARAAFAGTPVERDRVAEEPGSEAGWVEEFFLALPDATRVPGVAWTEWVFERAENSFFYGRPRRTLREPAPDCITVDGDWTGHVDARGTDAADLTGSETARWAPSDGLLLSYGLSIAVRTAGERAAEGTVEVDIVRLGVRGDSLPAPRSATGTARAPGAEDVKFGLTARPGLRASFRYSRTSSSTHMDASGEAETGVDDLTRDFELFVKSAGPGGGAVVELTCRAVRGRIGTGSAVIHFDSSGKATPALDSEDGLVVVFLTALAGKKVELHLDAAGTPTAVRGVREIIEAATKGLDPSVVGDRISSLRDKDLIELAADGVIGCLIGTHTTSTAWTAHASRRLGAITGGFDETFTLLSSANGRATVAETYAWDPERSWFRGSSGTGTGRSVWNRADGFAESVEREWRVSSRGNVSFDAVRKEELVRVPAPASGPKPR